MNRGFLDSFQLIIAAYLFYTAIRGKGTLFNFPEVPKGKRDEVHKNLRIAYTVCGFIALLDGCASILQNDMYTVTYTEAGAEIAQNYTIGALPFISFDLLTKVSIVCTFLVVFLAIGIMVYIRKVSRH